jgi:hypothetical protein
MLFKAEFNFFQELVAKEAASKLGIDSRPVTSFMS